LRWIARGESGSTALPTEGRSRVTERLMWAAAILLLLAGLLWVGTRGREPSQTLRSYLPPPPEVGFDFTGDFSGPPVIAADGTAIAFCARNQKDRDLIWVQSLSDLAPRKLEGTDGASFPFWSFDGRFLGFFADGHLKKVPAAGGPVTVLADSPNPRGGSWNQDNVIIYEPDYRDSLWRISASGGTPVRLTKFEESKHTTHRWPRFLADGKHFLFFATNHSGGSEQGIYFGSLKDGSYKHVIDSDSDAQYASGYLLYHLQSALLAQKFDPGAGIVSGDPVPVASSVEYDSSTWHTTFTTSQNGVLVYEPGSKAQGSRLIWLDRNGKVLNRIGEQAFYKGGGQISPDGKRLAVSMGDPQADIWVFDLARGSHTRLTFGGATHLMPSWSADGQKIVYVRQSGVTAVTGTSLRARLANGGGQEEIVMEGENSATAHTLSEPQWSPDGRYILHMEQSGPTVTGIWALPTFGDKKPFAIVQPQTPQARIIQARLSPDGRWLAYSSTESGREEVYVTHFPGGAGKWQVSQTGGTFPTWRADSKEIFYFGFDAYLHSASVDAKSGEFELGPVGALFQVNYIAAVGNAYDVSPDGQHFIFATNPESVSTPLVLVTNWTADLKK